jgi:hypothetical protein
LLEYGTCSDRFLYIRTDAEIKDSTTGSVVPMAFNRRSNPVSVPAKYKSGPQDMQHVRVIERSVYNPQKKRVICMDFTVTNKVKSSASPLYRIPCELVFEVRKDGSPYLHAWAKLPTVGRYGN